MAAGVYRQAEISRIILPTVYGEADTLLIRKIKKLRPDYIVMFGYAKTADPVRLEQFAHNMDSKVALDNKGKTGHSVIISGGEARLETTFQIAKLVKDLSQQGVNYILSNDAGGFLCNHAYYIALHQIYSRNLDIPCIFLHVGKRLDAQEEALKALEVILNLQAP